MFWKSFQPMGRADIGFCYVMLQNVLQTFNEWSCTRNYLFHNFHQKSLGMHFSFWPIGMSGFHNTVQTNNGRQFHPFMFKYLGRKGLLRHHSISADPKNIDIAHFKYKWESETEPVVYYTKPGETHPPHFFCLKTYSACLVTLYS